MDISIANALEEKSDYGSDFTLDEEEILNGILQQPPPKLVSYPDLPLANTEDNENIYTARIPPDSRYRTLGSSAGAFWKEKWKKGKSKIPVEIESHGSVSTAGKLCVDCEHDETN